MSGYVETKRESAWQAPFITIHCSNKKICSFIMEKNYFCLYNSILLKFKSEMILISFVLHGYCKTISATVMYLIDTSGKLSIDQR